MYYSTDGIRNACIAIELIFQLGAHLIYLLAAQAR